MSISSENRKLYRKSMLVACGLDEYVADLTATPTTRYGNGSYDTNMRCGNKGIVVKLMDLAGDGFPLDGSRVPITTKAMPKDGWYGMRPSYQGHVKTGIPAQTASDSSGTTSTIGVSLSGIPSGASYVTAHLRDSAGKTYRVVASPGGIQSVIRSTKVTPGARIYIDRIVAGRSWQWEKSTLVDCTLELRGVETKGDSPELQLSEIEIHGLIDKKDIGAISGMADNSPIWYAAGYADDVTPTRRFYLSDRVKTEGIVAEVKGYDASKFLDSQHYAVVSGAPNGIRRGRFLYEAARRCYGVLGRGLVYDHLAEFARPEFNMIKKGSSTDEDMRYMTANGLSRREVVAAYVNLFHSASGGYGGSGFYVDYVDAGLPTFRADTKPIGKSTFGHRWNLGMTDIADYAIETEVPISEISAMVAWPKKEIKPDGTVKSTSFYAENLTLQESRYIHTEDAYTGAKFKGYNLDEHTSDGGAKRWIHCQIGDLYRVVAHFYPDTRAFGYSSYVFRIKALKTAKERLIGIRNLPTNPESLPGLPFRAEYEDGRCYYRTGHAGEKVEFPEVFYSRMLQAGSSGGGSVRSEWGYGLKQIAERSNRVHKFTYRGNPKMQPRDIINLDTGSGTIELTIDKISLEHKEGGLVSEIEAREGAI